MYRNRGEEWSGSKASAAKVAPPVLLVFTLLLIAAKAAPADRLKGSRGIGFSRDSPGVEITIKRQ